MTTRYSLTAMTGLILISAIAPTTQAQEKVPFDKLPDRWQKYMDLIDGPGAAVAVVQNGSVRLLLPLGHRDAKRRSPVTIDTPFYIASSTKSFVALAIVILAERGKLDLNAPVKKYLPRFDLADKRAANAITIRDLLSHRQGLRDFRITVGEAFTGNINEDRYYRLLARDVTPSGSFRYSNLHFTLLGRVIEAVDGRTWKAFVHDEILKPLGLKRTYTSADSMYALDDVAIPMVRTAGPRWVECSVRKTDRTMHAAGGMGASARDLAAWLRFNMGDGSLDGKRLLSAESLRAMHAPLAPVNKQFALFTREHYGLGWYVGGYDGETLVHHFGGFAGARAHVSFMPQHGIGVAVVVNSNDRATFQLADVIAVEAYDSLLDKPLEDRSSELRKLAGRDPADGWSVPRPNRKNNPAVAKDGLSLPRKRYAGTFASDEMGEIEFYLDSGRLACTFGVIHPGIVSRGTDRVVLYLTHDTTAINAEFEVSKGRVQAVTLQIPGGGLRFERTATADPRR